MSSTPYVTTDTVLTALTSLTAVDSTAPTNTTPYGFSQTQATEILTQLNAIISLLQAGNYSGPKA